MDRCKLSNRSDRSQTPLRQIAVVAALLIIASAATETTMATDWPTYRADSARSAVSPDELDVPLSPQWVWRSPAAPQMASDGPAKRDSYNKLEGLKNRIDFDRVFHPVIAGGAVYLSSSATDQILCLDATTGEERWSFFTEGPVRLAPTVHERLVICGSDDGHVYALDATRGQLVWKVRIGPSDERLPGNLRIISRWPVRTGAVVRDGVVYIAAGMFPHEGVYVVALNVHDGSQIWRTETPQLPAQGYLLASATRLYVPSGRNNPIVFDRQSGKVLRVVEGAGGTYCLLSGDTLVFGPGKTGELGLVEPEQRDQLATFRGNHMIITPEASYLQSDDTLTSLDRARYLQLAQQRRNLVAERAALQQSIDKQDVVDKVQAGAKLAAQTARIAEMDTEMKECQQWSIACQSPHAMILAGGAVVVGGEDEVSIYRKSDGQRIWHAAVEGGAYGLAAAGGQLFVSTDRGIVHTFGSSAAQAGTQDAEAINPTVAAPDANDTAPAKDRVAADSPLSEPLAQTAEQILQLSGWRSGYALVLGSEGGELALELARRSKLHVVVAEPDATRANALRRRLMPSGHYGWRVAVHVVPLDKLPYIDAWANVLVNGRIEREKEFAGDRDEVWRVVRPDGGAAFLDSADLRQPTFREALPGAGRWTHQYGEADNSACSKDELVRGNLRVQWWGPPGPRPMPDRGGRNPSPLSVGGFLFTLGDRILFGQDAYNGTIYWSLSLPELRRSNLPRDCGNMAAAADALYVAAADKCMLIEPRTGAITQSFKVVTPSGLESSWNWGYVGYLEDILIGSAVSAGVTYVADEGEWYENYVPEQISRVVSPVLFAMNRHTGESAWTYQQGAVLNSTITIAGDGVYFVEARGAQARASTSARLAPDALQDLYLVALDRRTGTTRWEQQVDLSMCQYMTYMASGKDKLIVSGTDQQKTFHHFAFDQATGQRVWERHDSAAKTHHSGHLDHMVIIGDKVYSNLHVMDLHTGRDIAPQYAERRGCGVMAGSNHMLMFRDHFHSLWDLETDKRWELPGIRSGCWLGIIPAGGLVLAPESSSGCSCTHAIQTSVGFRPWAE